MLSRGAQMANGGEAIPDPHPYNYRERQYMVNWCAYKAGIY